MSESDSLRMMMTHHGGDFRRISDRRYCKYGKRGAQECDSEFESLGVVLFKWMLFQVNCKSIQHRETCTILDSFYSFHHAFRSLGLVEGEI